MWRVPFLPLKLLWILLGCSTYFWCRKERREWDNTVVMVVSFISEQEKEKLNYLFIIFSVICFAQIIDLNMSYIGIRDKLSTQYERTWVQGELRIYLLPRVSPSKFLSLSSLLRVHAPCTLRNYWSVVEAMNKNRNS